ncbi:hypothetical protein AGRA3207_005144 [Actinomadura graeca]|uniref:Carboxypeptidase n=1 Tax=Actinomadura graeca TaxID=2750812 RepID=A0ABX8R1R5_9ACTN|nr:S10 family peptidase [Actinomadura graeca]QXJ23917.1 hypothetical protein AGRA3207_005144 [Actinomadura graeca]
MAATGKAQNAPAAIVDSIPANIFNTLRIDLYTKDTKKARSYAGYAHVDSKTSKGKKNHLFYWLFESQTCSPNVAVHDQQDEISKTPLLIWLNGGPGASSLAGLFLEHGPLSIAADGAGTISVSPNSWNEEAHVVYWDQPIGSGYSYSDAGEYVKDEEALSEMFWEALQQFYGAHPEYAKCPLYISGQSYAGKYVPAIALKIHQKNGEKAGRRIELKGIAVGNGWIKPELSLRVMIDFCYATGFLGINQTKPLNDCLTKIEEAIKAGKMKEASKLGDELVAKILKLGGNFDVYDVRRWDGLPFGAMRAYLNNKDVKKALHVPADVTWQFADNEGPVAENLAEDIMADCSEQYAELLEEGYKTLLYTGNFDTACGYLATEEMLADLEKWSDPHENEAWLNAPRLVWTQAQGDPKGFVRRHKNLTQVALPDAGHVVPAYQPRIAREMIYNWVFGRPFVGYDPQQQLKQPNGNSGSRKGEARPVKAGPWRHGAV